MEPVPGDAPPEPVGHHHLQLPRQHAQQHGQEGGGAAAEGARAGSGTGTGTGPGAGTPGPDQPVQEVRPAEGVLKQGRHGSTIECMVRRGTVGLIIVRSSPITKHV